MLCLFVSVFFIKNWEEGKGAGRGGAGREMYLLFTPLSN